MANEVTKCVKALLAKRWTVAFAESASAGLMSYQFSAVPESGRILLGGVVCYHECLKEGLLGIPAELIGKHTAESPEVTQAMAEGLKKITNADVCVALTGLTTPGGSETAQKPVGTVFIHIIFPRESVRRRFVFDGKPREILDRALSETCGIIVNKCNHGSDAPKEM